MIKQLKSKLRCFVGCPIMCTFPPLASERIPYTIEIIFPTPITEGLLYVSVVLQVSFDSETLCLKDFERKSTCM